MTQRGEITWSRDSFPTERASGVVCAQVLELQL